MKYAFCIDERRLLLDGLHDPDHENRLKAVRRLSDLADRDQASFLKLEKENPIALLNIIYLLLSESRNGSDGVIRYESKLAVDKIRTILSPRVGKEYGCIKCGSRIKMGWKYCTTCGSSIKGWDKIYKKCKICDSPVISGWNYCAACRSPVLEKISVSSGSEVSD